ncbi:hypothetical protein ACVW1A_003146 [Bradyrhizobium sp. LB1.3]
MCLKLSTSRKASAKRSPARPCASRLVARCSITRREGRPVSSSKYAERNSWSSKFFCSVMSEEAEISSSRPSRRIGRWVVSSTWRAAPSWSSSSATTGWPELRARWQASRRDVRLGEGRLPSMPSWAAATSLTRRNSPCASCTVRPAGSILTISLRNPSSASLAPEYLLSFIEVMNLVVSARICNGAILRSSLLSLVKGSGEIRGCFAAMRRAQPIVINSGSTRPAKPRTIGFRLRCV